MEDIDEVQPSPTPQDQFDALVKQKNDLWESIKRNAMPKLSDEWRQIEEIDRQLWSLKRQMEE